MDEWISAETEAKEADLRGLIRILGTVARQISWRHGHFYYVDCHAGPGWLTYKERTFKGSPLVAAEVLTDIGIPHKIICCEKNAETAERLRAALPDAEVRTGRCEKMLRLNDALPDPRRFGLVYADPIGEEIPVDLLTGFAQKYERMDLLAYVAATAYKRRRGAYPGKPFLSDHVDKVPKKVKLIRRMNGNNQYTFVLWSNWDRLPDWRNRGFYRLDSPEGLEVMDRLNLSRREQQAAAPALFPVPDIP